MRGDRAALLRVRYSKGSTGSSRWWTSRKKTTRAARSKTDIKSPSQRRDRRLLGNRKFRCQNGLSRGGSTGDNTLSTARPHKKIGAAASSNSIKPRSYSRPTSVGRRLDQSAPAGDSFWGEQRMRKTVQSVRLTFDAASVKSCVCSVKQAARSIRLRVAGLTACSVARLPLDKRRRDFVVTWWRPVILSQDLNPCDNPVSNRIDRRPELSVAPCHNAAAAVWCLARKRSLPIVAASSCSSSLPSHFATTTVASALPIRFTKVSPSARIR